MNHYNFVCGWTCDGKRLYFKRTVTRHEVDGASIRLYDMDMLIGEFTRGMLDYWYTEDNNG